MEGESLDSSGQQSTAERPALVQSSAKEFVFPLSYAQQRLWLLDRLLPTGSIYNVPKVYRLRGALRVEALQWALDELVERHESLRTRFGFEESGPVQVIAARLRVELAVEDLTGLAAGEREGEARRRAQEEAQTPFDLERAPLLRARLLRVHEQEHWLLLTLHHIITDGWSSGVLARELSELYGAHCRGEASGLPGLPVQYADYAVWQREWLQGEVLEQQLAYWKPALAGLPALELPTDRPRPPMASFRGERIDFEIDRATDAERSRTSAAREGATLFMTLLAAFQVLLYRYSGQEDIAVGAPIAGRVRPELGRLDRVLRQHAGAARRPLGRPELHRVSGGGCARGALEAYAHQDLPFEKLVEELHPKRDLSRNPLFQVALAMQNTPQVELRLLGVDVEPVTDLSNESAKFDLHFSITEVAGTLRTRVEYATDLFDAGTIERMVGHWRVLLSGIVADPAQPISRLPLLTAEEWRGCWQSGMPPRSTIRASAAFTSSSSSRSSARRRLSRSFVASDSSPMRELNARANRLAHHLRGLGVGPDVPVGVCLERSLDLVVGLLAILKAGGAYVPLDPGYPAQRLAFMLEDTQARIVLTREPLSGVLPADGARMLCIDRDSAAIAQAPVTNPAASANATSLAYVMYTSGSTGQPKGVMIEHRAVNRLVCNTDYVRLAADDCVAFASNVAFDAATFELWGALVNGARLVILAKETILDAVLLAAAIAQQRITTMFVTTALFNSLARAPSPPFGGLTNLLVGGEVCDASAARCVLERGAPKRLLNVYGPTETTTFATAYHIISIDGAAEQVPIGRPIANTSAYVLNGQGQPQPIGVRGELHIGGDGVARGYLRRPELSAEHFIADRFGGRSEGRLYKTGDIARWRSDGGLDFVGRRDHQIKIRGFRIELGEIEATLTQHPSVADAIVLARQDVPGGPRLVAYLVARSSPPPAARALHDFAKARLPDYMVPVAFVIVGRFPTTPAGKVDRSGFAPPDDRSTIVADRYAAPRDDMERLLCRIWAEALGVDRVGLDDDFFDMGGHSLLGARLMARLDEEFGQALSLGILFKTPTVRKLAEYLRSSTPLDGCASLVAITIGTSRPSLFAVGGGTGSVLAFADLARALGPDQGFYALQSVGLDGTREPLDSIEAMAQLYISEIRSVQPRGPYALIGSCFGATVVYEMARRLAESGEEVAFLGLLDPTRIGGEDAGRPVQRSPESIKRAAVAGRFVMSRLQLYRSELHELGARERVVFFGRKLRTLLRRMSGRGSLEGVRLEVSLMKVHGANVAALRRFERKPLVRRRERTRDFRDAPPRKGAHRV